MTELLGLFANNLLPIFVIAGVGYALASVFRLEPRAMSLVTFHAFSPCLVFVLITSSQLGGEDVTRMAAFSVVAILLPGLLAVGAARLLRLPRRPAAALVLVVMLANAGNYGLSATKLAFGEAALAYAAVYFSASILVTFTVGVVVASLGRADLRTALLGVFKVPTIYAVFIALLMRWLGWSLPVPLDRSVGLLADAAIPAMLVVLGMQLHQNGTLRATRSLGIGVGLRLVVAPAVAIVVARMFALPPHAQQAGVFEAAMPTAVVATVLAETYDVEPQFVTMAVFVSTILSPITLTPLMAWLGSIA